MKIVDSWLVDVNVSGLIGDVVVNDVDVTAFVEAELDRRHPERAQVREMQAADDYRKMWDTIERLWSDTVARARRLPEDARQERVDDEWSFVETLRHLVFATDAWVGRTVLDEPMPYHRLGYPYSGYPASDAAAVGVDLAARPSFDEVIDVRADRIDAHASAELKRVGDATNLDALLEAGRPVWEELRSLLQESLADQSLAGRIREHLHRVDEVRLHLPFTVGDYVDFYGNEYHASNVGRIFRPEQAPLTANWKHLPIGYHGRSGSIVPSETPVHRPKGMRPEPGGTPSFGPSTRLDIEAEVGFVLGGRANAGEVTLEQAENHIFGLTLTNDWSARDIQAFEYVPLGPNLGKSFATSIASWVTPVAALDAVRTAPPPRDTPLAKYLDDTDTRPWGFNLQIEVVLNDETVSPAPVRQHLLDRSPDARAHDSQRCRLASGRLLCRRHDLRPRKEPARIVPGTGLGRNRAPRPCRRQ